MISTHLLNEVIIPVLKHLDMDSDVARYLLLGTIAQESHMGRYLVQLDDGPALGIVQMEPATHDDIWQNFLAYRPWLAKKLTKLLCPQLSKTEQLKWNLMYAVAMARVQYYRVPDALPKLSLIDLTHYWKKHYNTVLGKGTVDEFHKNFRRFIGEVPNAPDFYGSHATGFRLASGSPGNKKSRTGTKGG